MVRVENSGPSAETVFGVCIRTCTRCTYSQCMPRTHLMIFEPTGNTFALLLVGVASAYGTVDNAQTMSVTKCEKDGKVYAERVPESK